MLRNESFVLQILSQNGAAGYCELIEGRLQLRLGRHPPPVSPTRPTSKDAARGMMSRDRADWTRALEDGQCELASSFQAAMWFHEAMKIARSV
jgi:hypothetical protein